LEVYAEILSKSHKLSYIYLIQLVVHLIKVHMLRDVLFGVKVENIVYTLLPLLFQGLLLPRALTSALFSAVVKEI
jgi:hypothetical protein